MKWFGFLMTLTLAGFTLSAQINTPVRYTLRFPDPKTHYVSVEALLPAGGQPRIEVFMPVWTPGSYLVREFARNVENLHATDDHGKTLAISKSRKNRWLIETGGAAAVKLTYDVYGREMSVRTNWVEESFALLNGAPTFLTLADGRQRAHEVQVELPSNWKTIMTGMQEAPGGQPNRFIAADYDTLVDSPILAGNPAVYRFEVDGIPHFLVNEGEGGVWDGPKSVKDVEKIVRRYREMWGSLPYKKYVFLNVITEAGGGLEHKNSVCMMTSRWATRNVKPYHGWLGLVAHEYFHAWNVKRLRPVELGPFDYEKEVHTKSLWVSEGFTDYYAPLTLKRAGITTENEYLGTSLSDLVNRLQTTPGRLLQSAQQASYNAWIKLYRPDENSVNTTISYYTKGAVIGWLLDARIRRDTNGAKSLDDLMRLAFERYSGAKGFTPEQFEAAAEDVAGKALHDFFRKAVHSTEELDYTEALDWYGLRWKKPEPPKDGAPPKAWTGADTKVDNGRLTVTRILRGTPAYASGLNVDDEILGIGDYRVKPDQWAQRLDQYRPNDTVSLLVARREKFLRIEMKLAEEPKKWQLEARPDASPDQKVHLSAWLK